MGERPVAIVTGGSAGIGAAICRHMIEPGHEVVSLAHGRPDWSNPSCMRSKWTEARATAKAAAGVAKEFVARAVMFFTARANSFITGQVLYVCGGTSVASISF